MTEQEMLQKLKLELNRLLERYERTKDPEDLDKANAWRIKYAELDVKLNGHRGTNV